MNDIKRADFAHFVPINVRWGEMDSLGHVNNTVFYRYSEDGRIDYITRLVEDPASISQTGPILADLRCSFVQQLRYPAAVEIATRTTRIGRSSLQVQQVLFHADSDTVVAVYEAALVWFDYAAQTSAPVPEAARARIRAMEAVAPEE